jgi:LysR family hydrogen peroxide-inducible transcriptional activator
MAYSLNAFKLLIAVDEAASFTGAARRLDRPQPWVSAQVRAWEEKSGYRLFERSRHPSQPVTPTARGRELIAQARRVLAELEAFEQLLGEADTAPLRIGADPVTAEYPGRAALFDRVTKRYPDLALKVVNMDDEMALESVRAGTLDLCVIVAAAPSSKIFRSKLLCKLPASLLVPREHPLAGMSHVPAAALRGQPLLISTRPTHPLSAGVLRFWQELGADVKESFDAHPLATTRMAQRLRIMTTTLLADAPRDWGLADMVQRPLQDIDLALDLRVVSLRKPVRALVDKFWVAVE